VILTKEQLQDVLEYNPETGVFTWKIRAAQNVRIGDVAGQITSKGYVRIKILGKQYMAHRLAWLYVHGGFMPDQADHINGVRDDNRIANLRNATHAENMMNRRVQSNNESGYPGVHWASRKGKWRADCAAYGRRKYLGMFATAELAFEAYQAYSIQHQGEFKRGVE